MSEQVKLPPSSTPKRKLHKRKREFLQKRPPLQHHHLHEAPRRNIVVIDLEQRQEEADDEALPHNEEESRLLTGVLEQNCSYKGNKHRAREILRAIRRLVAQQKEPNESQQQDEEALTVQLVLTEIQNHRMVLAEARQMDQARLASEQQHDEEAAVQRQALRQRLESASFDDWKSLFFPSSCILNNMNCVKALSPVVAACEEQNSHNRTGGFGGGGISRNSKLDLLRLLQLEQKACRWYSNLGQAYFNENVCQAIVSTAATGIESTSLTTKTTISTLPEQNKTLEMFLLDEVERLEKSMFCLSEQVGGVPRLFRDAHDNALRAQEQQQSSSLTAKNKDNDSDVVLVIQPPQHNDDSKHSSGGNVNKDRGRSGNVPSVLEIL